MRADDFEPTSAGTLVQNLNGVLSFLPGRLPPTLRWSLPLVSVTTRATQAIATLCGLGGRFPRPERLIRLFMRREAEFSSLIEETHASIRTMLLFDHVADVRRDNSAAREVQNNYHVLLSGLAAIEERPVTLGLLRQLHVELFAELDAQHVRPGNFRTVPVYIGSTPVIGEARFVPPPPLEVEHCMRALETYVREPDDVPPIVRAAIAHYQFEAIHPFNDGNGRIGRALMLLMLVREGLLTVPLLNPSAGLERNRRDYYDHLLDVSRRGAWENWIHFFCERVIEEAAHASDRLLGLDRLRLDYHDRIRHERSSGTLANVVDELFAEPVQTAASVATRLSVTPPSANKTIQRLVDLKILTEVTGRQRDRVFMANELVDLFTTPPSPR